MVVFCILNLIIFVLCVNGTEADLNLESFFVRIKREASSCQDVQSTESDCLFYKISKNVDKQIAVINKTARSAVVIDPINEQYGFLNGDGYGAFYDQQLDIGFQTQNGHWKNNLESSAPDVLMTSVMENLEPVELDSRKNPFSSFVENILEHFGFDMNNVFSQAAGSLMTIVKKLFAFIIHPIKNVVGSILDFLVDDWTAIKGGLLSFLKVFKWIGEFVSQVSGGIRVLLTKLIRFPLKLITIAINGAKAFLLMLQNVSEHFDLTKILNSVIQIPATISNFIYGLGGEVMQGINGLFKIIGNVIDFAKTVKNHPITEVLTYAASSGFKIIVDSVATFFDNGQRENLDVRNTADSMLQIVKRQEELFDNGPQLQNYNKFWKATKGEDKYEIDGVDVSTLVGTLTDQKTTSSVDMIMGVTKDLNPVLPYQFSVPQYMHHEIDRINGPDGRQYIYRMLPETAEELMNQAENRVMPSDDDDEMSTTDLLEKYPVAKAIYEKVNESMMRQEAEVDVNSLLNAEGPATQKLRKRLLEFGSL